MEGRLQPAICHSEDYELFIFHRKNLKKIKRQ